MKVSVILPCFNHARYLERRISSILSQTHPVDQIIFLDDASTDHSVFLAKKLLADFDGRLDFYANSVNSGSPFFQWNIGVKLAVHELIWIAETDDSCSPFLLERLYKCLVTTQSIFCYAQSRYINSHDQPVGSSADWCNSHWPNAFERDFCISGSTFNSKFLFSQNAIPNASSVLFSRREYLDVGGANSSMRFAGDWQTWISLSQIGTVAFVAEDLNYFRSHDQTTRSKGYLPRVAAEIFACRLLSTCHSINSHQSNSLSIDKFDFADLYKTIIQFGFSRFLLLLVTINYHDFSATAAAYQSLQLVPRISNPLWLFLRFCRFVLFVLRKLYGLRNKLPSFVLS